MPQYGVSRAEIEGLFAHRVMILPDAAHSRSEERLRAIGRTRRGRAIFVVFTIRDHDGEKYIRPVSARYMHREAV
jgi:uncharacterized protein